MAESLRIAHETGALRTNDLARVTVDTTVQPKAITFPTDAKLLHARSRGSIAWPTRTACGCGKSMRKVAKLPDLAHKSGYDFATSS